MVKVVTDSNADLGRALCAQIGVADVAATHVIFGDESFSSLEMSPADFHARLRASAVLPKTSQPSVGDFVSLFERLQNDEVVSIHISRDLSGTIASAESAAIILAGHPPVTVVDTRTVSAAMALLVMEAVTAASAGKSALEVKAHIESLVPRTRMHFVLETLENLRRGGRIGGAQALIGGVLQVKPILTIKDGRVEPLERVRTSSKALARLKEIVVNDLQNKPNPRLCLMHVAAPELGQQVADDLHRALNIPLPMLLEAGPAIATHAGPGAVGVGYIM